MQTKKLVLDFSYLRDKKFVRTAKEFSGVRRSSPAHSLVTANRSVSQYFRVNIQDSDESSYFALMKKSMSFFDTYSRDLEQLVPEFKCKGSFPKYEITYSTHNEPKEYFMGCYIGKKTGYIYLSNQGDDVVINTRRFNHRVFHHCIKAIQYYKLTLDSEEAQRTYHWKYMGQENQQKQQNNGYLGIFDRSNTEMVDNAFPYIEKEKYNPQLWKSTLYSLLKLIRASLPFVLTINLISSMLSHGVGRISKVSEDMEEIIDDFNKCLIPENLDMNMETLWQHDVGSNLFNSVVLRMSSEYTTTDVFKINWYDMYKNTDLLKSMMLKSVIDNSESPDASIYSDEFLNVIKQVHNIPEQQFKKMKDSLVSPDFYNKYFNSNIINSHEVLSKSINTHSLSNNILFQSSKIGYKYLQRIHSILERI